MIYSFVFMVLSHMDPVPLSIGDGGRGVGFSGRPLLDLNLPSADADPAPRGPAEPGIPNPRKGAASKANKQGYESFVIGTAKGGFCGCARGRDYFYYLSAAAREEFFIRKPMRIT